METDGAGIGRNVEFYIDIGMKREWSHFKEQQSHFVKHRTRTFHNELNTYLES